MLVFFLQIQVGPPALQQQLLRRRQLPSLLSQPLLVDYHICKHNQSTSAQHPAFKWVTNGKVLEDAVSEIRSFKK